MLRRAERSGGQQSEGDGERYYAEALRIHSGMLQRFIFRPKVFAAAKCVPRTASETVSDWWDGIVPPTKPRENEKLWEFLKGHDIYRVRAEVSRRVWRGSADFQERRAPRRLSASDARAGGAVGGDDPRCPTWNGLACRVQSQCS
jgi:hypothetical protein